MNPAYISHHLLTDCRVGAWLATVAVTAVGFMIVRQHLAYWLLLLYRYFIQNFFS